MSMKFEQAPGVFADVLLSLSMHYNQDNEESMLLFVNPKRRAADLRYYRESLLSFEQPAPEMIPLFALSGDRSYALSVLLKNLCDAGNLSVDGVSAILPDANAMALDVLRFYLPRTGKTLPTPAELSASLVKLDTDDAVKYHLLSMCIDPQRYYDLLLHTLSRRTKEIKPLFTTGKTELRRVRDDVDEVLLKEFLAEQWGASEKTLNALTLSITLFARNTLTLLDGPHPLLLIGSDYESRMKTLTGEIKPDIVLMGKALSEEKRVTILRMLLNEGEITSLKLQRRLKLSMTATHYHLELLQQAGMLLTRNEGRTIYYSLNRSYFEHAPALLEEFGPEKSPSTSF